MTGNCCRFITAWSIVLWLALHASSLAAQPLQTPGETNDWDALSSHQEVTEFFQELTQRSEAADMQVIGQSRQERDLHLVTLSDPAVSSAWEAHRSDKPVLFIGAQIHGDEPAGKEGLMEFARDLAFGELNWMLEEVIFLFIPQMNPDGGELGEWGTRANAAGYNLNRDFPRLDNPEAQAVAQTVLDWRPHVVVDAHELVGPPRIYDFYTWHPNNPNSPDLLYDYASDHVIPDIVEALEAEGFTHTIYHTPEGLFTEPEEGIFVPLYGRTLNDYAEALGSISILYESVRGRDARVDIEDRTQRHRVAMEALAEHVANNGERVVEVVDRAMEHNRTMGRADSIAVEVDHAKSETISYRVAEMEEEEDVSPWEWEPTGDTLDLEVPLYDQIDVIEARERPSAYLIEPHRHDLAETLSRHDIQVERLRQPVELEVEAFEITSRTIADSPYEGYIPIEVESQLEPTTQDFEDGTWLVRTNQPEAALIFKLLEPEDENSLVITGELTTEVNEGATLPIYRLHESSDLPTTVW